MRIKNLTNSPYPILLADGSKDMLPARGELENVEVHPQHMPLYRQLGYFEISEDEPKKAKVDKVEPEPEPKDEPDTEEKPDPAPAKRGRPRKGK